MTGKEHQPDRPHVPHTVDIKTVVHSPYSSVLAPCDFWLCPEVKIPLRG